MRLKLRELQQIVNQTLSEEKAVDVLREEISRVLGPAVVTNVRLEELAESANDRIDVMERTGKSGHLDFKPSILLKFANNQNAEVRRLAARLLPEQFLERFKNDKDISVRHTVAKRLPLQIVKEMFQKTPGDDELNYIFQQRISEAGIPQPKKQDPHLHMHVKKLGDAVKQQHGPELSDQWYATTAQKAMMDYNHNMEGKWDEAWVYRYCASVKATSGVEIDANKLWSAIQDRLKEKDDLVLARFGLKEVAQRLREGISEEIHTYVESKDAVQELLEANLSHAEYVKKAQVIFCVKESIMPASLRKYRMAEGYNGDVMIPCIGKTPGSRALTHLDEIALDIYVKNWNGQQTMRGEPIKINWSPSPSNQGAVSFNVELK